MYSFSLDKQCISSRIPFMMGQGIALSPYSSVHVGLQSKKRQIFLMRTEGIDTPTWHKHNLISVMSS